MPLIIRLHPPNIFMPHISELDNLFFWSSLHFGQEIGHLGSDDLFLVFTSLHFIVEGKNLGNRAGVSNLLNHPPQSRKMAKNGQFCRIIPPMLNIDLHLCWIGVESSTFCSCRRRNDARNHFATLLH